MESTGVYWITLYEILEECDLIVQVVNARHVKNVPGRIKSDVLDRQWIQKLHSFGLGRGAPIKRSGFICGPSQVKRRRPWSKLRSPPEQITGLLQVSDTQDVDGAEMMNPARACSQHCRQLFTKEKGPKRK